MRLSLIGMSGAGKSHWSKRLGEDCGFVVIDCDEILECQMASEVASDGRDKHDIASWLGQPYESQFEENQVKLLCYEKKMMREILWNENILEDDSNLDVVIDTSGSVIYTGEEILQRLKRRSTVVCLETPPSVMHVMYERFLNNSRGIFWGEQFKQLQGESESDALARCYKKLCSWREQRYRAIADVRISHEVHASKKFSVDELLQRVGGQ